MEEVKEASLEGKTLYVGADDSNNHDTRRARILAATFSLDSEDSVYRTCPRQRDESFESWLGEESKSRNFRFALLTEPCFSAMQPILPLAVPKLVLDYAPTLKETPKKVWICIDGVVPYAHKEYIRDSLGHYFDEVVVNNVVKRRNEMAKHPRNKRLYCPRILKMADICANQIYDFFTTDHLEQRIQVNQEALRKLYEELRKAA